jgi:hypothetical protein
MCLIQECDKPLNWNQAQGKHGFFANGGFPEPASSSQYDYPVLGLLGIG